MSSRKKENHIQYEELVKHIPCPTCRGSGKIPKDSKEEYIALIPLSDRRLRPRHTLLKVGLAITICLIISGLLLFFLTPRSIKLTTYQKNIRPYYAVADENKGKVFIALYDFFNISNNNWVPVRVQKIQVDAMTFMSNLVLRQIVNTTSVFVGGQEKALLMFSANYTILDEDLKGVVVSCMFEERIVNQIPVEFTITVEATILGQSVEASLRTMQNVDCHPTTNSTYIPPNNLAGPWESSVVDTEKYLMD